MSSLILTTQAAHEEYLKRVGAEMAEIEELLESEHEGSLVSLDLIEKHSLLADLAFNLRVALRNPKLGINVTLDRRLIRMILK